MLGFVNNSHLLSVMLQIDMCSHISHSVPKPLLQSASCAVTGDAEPESSLPLLVCYTPRHAHFLFFPVKRA